MKLAVVATVFRRQSRYLELAHAVQWQSRPPDALYIMYEDPLDDVVGTYNWGILPRIVHFEPISGQIPPATGINEALDLISAREDGPWGVAYLTDDSLPQPKKYQAMFEALERGKELVYVSQLRHARGREWIDYANQEVKNPLSVVDHTQFAHVLTEDRWPTDNAPLMDGLFMQKLVAALGPMYGLGSEVLDHAWTLPDGLTARY